MALDHLLRPATLVVTAAALALRRRHHHRVAHDHLRAESRITSIAQYKRISPQATSSNLHVWVRHRLEDFGHVAREIVGIWRRRDVELPAEVQLLGHLEEVAVLAAAGRCGCRPGLVIIGLTK